MNFITGTHIPRRTFLRGLGGTVALPLLDAMIPAGGLLAQTKSGAAADATRLITIEMVHGSAGSNEYGSTQNLWSPSEVGKDFDLSPSSLNPLESYRKHLTIVSNTDVRSAEALTPEEIGGDHYRSSATFLTQSHPKQTESSDVLAGTSLDQIYAKAIGQDSPIPSMQLCIENVDQAGGCAYGYACAYTDTISWASPNEPLPMVRDPRVAFDQLFGAGGSADERAARRRSSGSILDWITGEVAGLKRGLKASDQVRLDQYLTNIREIERRIQKIEARNVSGEARVLPGAPAGVPDNFGDHVSLMFDLQVLAFESDLTRVFSFKLGRDGSARVYPDSGIDDGFHPASHHGGRPGKVEDFAQINQYHVSMLPSLLRKLENVTEGESNLLEKTMIIYGSPMGDSNLHNHKRCPLIVLGGANGKLEGEKHIHAPDGTPMANVMLGLMHQLGLDNRDTFGDSTDAFTI